MKSVTTKTFTLSALSLLLAAFVSTAQADHNSKWGEGWANMPNDVHNMRIDTLDGDNDDFIDFVSNGAGADSVNRFADDDTSVASSRGGSSAGGGGKR